VKHNETAQKIINTANQIITYKNTERIRLKLERIEKQEIASKKRYEYEQQIKLEREQNAAEKKEQLAKEQKQIELRRQLDKDAKTVEVNDLKKKLRALGYKGFINNNIINFIYTTQQNGDIGNYINHVVGSIESNKEFNHKQHKKVKILQTFKNYSLYTYSEILKSELFTLVILIQNEKGIIYQDGQSLQDDYLVFVGMQSYTTITGMAKTVPMFKRVKIK